MSRRSAGPVGVGIIGAGVIAGTYLDNLTSFPDVHVYAVGDLRSEAAYSRAAEHGIECYGGVEQVLDHPDVEIVVNLTIPAVHADVALLALSAGKHVYNEKPLGPSLESAHAVLRMAEAAGLRVGCAPDTFLGSGLQTALKMLNRGDIGTPLTALALMEHWGAESWHPSPEFLFQPGGGPLLDMGPYYLTTLVQALGPARSIAASQSTARATRTIGSGPRAGHEFSVEVPTHHGLLVSFEGGASAQGVFSSDAHQPRSLIEITGTDAVMELPDPNAFDGEIRVRRRGDTDWQVAARTAAVSTRGTGVLDLARAIRQDRPHRASGELAFHVLDLMISATEAAKRGELIPVHSTCRPSALLDEQWNPVASTLG